ncbi:uncharacterized protein LOC108865785 [Pyrus x bretschneideri]|uniref:uncharacterized protein LOC108865785 n=1 Tax=Pyrus x bretschneideri TaxID=225117 RepID=UPI002030DD2F|nr:uncharacterized protein LOC108865785 [Pyrus x bretschneideri]
MGSWRIGVSESSPPPLRLIWQSIVPFSSVAHNYQKNIRNLKPSNQQSEFPHLNFETNKSISSVKRLGSRSSNSGELFSYERQQTVPCRRLAFVFQFRNFNLRYEGFQIHLYNIFSKPSELSIVEAEWRSMKAEWVRSVALKPQPPNATPSLCFPAMALASTSPPPSIVSFNSASVFFLFSILFQVPEKRGEN